jgi:hypothetical protein
MAVPTLSRAKTVLIVCLTILEAASPAARVAGTTISRMRMAPLETPAATKMRNANKRTTPSRMTVVTALVTAQAMACAGEGSGSCSTWAYGL